MYERTIAQHLEKFVIPVTESGCWLYIGNIKESGYGAFKLKGKWHYAHRASYELHKGPIPQGLQLDHLCRVTCCVNPDHLEPVTNWENTLRTKNIFAQNALKTHCSRGHVLTGDNIYRRASGYRNCRTCRAIDKAAFNSNLKKHLGDSHEGLGGEGD